MNRTTRVERGQNKLHAITIPLEMKIRNSICDMTRISSLRRTKNSSLTEKTYKKRFGRFHLLQKVQKVEKVQNIPEIWNVQKVQKVSRALQL